MAVNLLTLAVKKVDYSPNSFRTLRYTVYQNEKYFFACLATLLFIKGNCNFQMQLSRSLGNWAVIKYFFYKAWPLLPISVWICLIPVPQISKWDSPHSREPFVKVPMIYGCRARKAALILMKHSQFDRTLQYTKYELVVIEYQLDV